MRGIYAVVIAALTPGTPAALRHRPRSCRDEPTDGLGRHAPCPTAPRARPLEEALYEVKRVIVGQDAMLERVLVALLAGGHVLLEGVPGLAKTLTVKTLADVLGGTFSRVQFTPDLVPVRPRRHAHLPARQRRVRHRARPGVRQLPAGRRDQPRAREGAVGAARGDAGAPGDDRRRDLPRCPSPFLVLATQNPIESEGTYPLPEAQVDRFLMKVVVDYPTPGEEAAVVGRALGACARGRAAADGRGPAALPRRPCARCTSTATVIGLRGRARRRHPPPASATAWPSSRRSSSTAPARAGRSAWSSAAQALALLRGRAARGRRRRARPGPRRPAPPARARPTTRSATA